MALSYFYDGQIRRYIEQLQRVFSQLQIHLGVDAYGNDRFYRVPCTYGDSDRIALHIKRENTENSMLPVPFMAIYDSDMQPAPERRQLPNHVDKRKYLERRYDAEQQVYTEEAGNRYIIERVMPSMYNMTVNLDVWYTQTDHKLQICEQLMMIFNHDMDLQTSTNPLDWTGLTAFSLQSIDWNRRGVPVGADDGLRITGMTFEIPIYINAPAKVKEQKVIHQIITDMYAANLTDARKLPNSSNEGLDLLNINPENVDLIFSDSSFLGRTIVTPGNHYIQVEDNVLTLLGPDQGELNPDTGEVWAWQDLIDQYDSPLQENISLVRLRPVSDIEEVEFDYIGRIRTHEEPNKLYWTADLETIPQDTLLTIDAIIDPNKNFPGEDLPNPANGQRYLIVDEISAQAQGDQWNNIAANVNDIIMFNGASWQLAFDSSAATGVQYATNGFTGKKLKYDPDTDEWTILPDGIWKPGYWRIVL